MRDIPLFKVLMDDSTHQPIIDVLKSGYVGQGPKVDEFERQLGLFFGNFRVNTINSGTAGLHIALRMAKDDAGLGFHYKNQVLTTPLTCTATNLPILANDLKIKWVDLNPDDCNLDLTDLRRKLSPFTLAIMVVHWGGYPVDLDELRSIQDECVRLYDYRPPIIEDCAHAFGATYKGKLLGNHGNMCMFSLQAIKHLTTGDGGLLVCPNDELHEKAKLLRWYGLDRTSQADFRCQQNIGKDTWGYKFHMNDIAATLGIHNLPAYKLLASRYVENAYYFQDALQGVDGVTLLKLRTDDRQTAAWIHTIRVRDRDNFIKKMKECGIGVSRVHDRNDKHDCFWDFRASLPNTDLVCGDMICIPCGWWVTDEDRQYIVDCIKKGW